MTSLGLNNFWQSQKFANTDLVGTWLTADGTGHIHVYEFGGKFFGQGINADGSKEMGISWFGRTESWTRVK